MLIPGREEGCLFTELKSSVIRQEDGQVLGNEEYLSVLLHPSTLVPERVNKVTVNIRTTSHSTPAQEIKGPLVGFGWVLDFTDWIVDSTCFSEPFLRHLLWLVKSFQLAKPWSSALNEL